MSMERDDIKINILRYPKLEDWQRCKALALNTVGKKYLDTIENMTGRRQAVNVDVAENKKSHSILENAIQEQEAKIKENMTQQEKMQEALRNSTYGGTKISNKNKKRMQEYNQLQDGKPDTNKPVSQQDIVSKNNADKLNKWKRRILIARHSPIRTLFFTIEMEIPYFAAMHIARHKMGIEHYVSSQRNDRQKNYDRELAPQNSPVTHIIDLNADALLTIAEKRLCNQADPTTRYIITKICMEVEKVCPEFEGLFQPRCGFDFNNCPEFNSCYTQIQNELQQSDFYVKA